MKTCPTCGQEIPPESPAHILSRMQRKVYDLLAKAGRYGLNSDQLFEKMYADDEGGGPLSGKKSMYVIVRMMNRRFVYGGFPYRIRAPKAGRGSTTNYKLERL